VRGRRTSFTQKVFQKVYDARKNQILKAPAENSRDSIMDAAQELELGNWKTCYDLIAELKIWDSLVPKEEIKAFKSLLQNLVQETGLRTFVLIYASFYHTISISRFSDMFSLSEERVRSLLARMILSGEIEAKFDILDTKAMFPESKDVRELTKEVAESAVAIMERNRKSTVSMTEENRKSDLIVFF
jgi:translation initiation factor 3 subunit C